MDVQGPLGSDITWSGVLKDINKSHPISAAVSVEMYATFWNLTLYDIHFPKER